MDTFAQREQINRLDKVLGRVYLTPISVLGLILLIVMPLVPPFNQEYLIRWLIVAAYVAAQAIAFDFTSGFINIVNFGFAAIVGLGAYTSAILAVNFGLTPWIGMFAGAVSAAVLGFIIGIITLRLRGIFAACLAWFFGLALMGLATKFVWLTRGPLGLRSPQLFETSSNLPYYYTILAMLFITYLITKWIISSRMGLAFKAIGQNMEAARTSGINPVFYRIVNFTVSCALAGWLGGFYAHYYGILTPDLMLTSKTMEVLIVAYIGGRASLWGGAAIAFPFVYATEMMRSSLSNLPGLNLIIYGIFLVVIMIYYPGGFAHFFNTYLRKPKSRALWYIMNGQQAAALSTGKSAKTA
ncbi:MAG: branched-chain amino acid ABC transporter permease [Deltaproteobacteria bacterium]|nr:branched-chain amino acid ABC transporter permease [Deltaproteobacteria bacterium]